jgi:tight adherence protein C
MVGEVIRLDPFDPFTIVLSLLVAVSAGGLGWYAAAVAQQITYVTLADGRRQERKLPVVFRMLLPLTPNFTPIFRKKSTARLREKTQRDIVAAGFRGLIAGDELLAMQFCLLLVFTIPWVFFVKYTMTLAPGEMLPKLENAFHTIGLLWLFLYPQLWLKQQLRMRHVQVRRSLPFVMDLLTLSVEAGMDFMTALQRNVERRRIDALSEELITVIREIQLGKTRREALRAMSERVNLSDLRSVVNALCQADELGVSIGSILRIQADQIRQRRFERAEKLANEAPVKMLFPLLFFIFPAVFLILLGPVVARILAQGF